MGFICCNYLIIKQEEEAIYLGDCSELVVNVGNASFKVVNFVLVKIDEVTQANKFEFEMHFTYLKVSNSQANTQEGDEESPKSFDESDILDILEEKVEMELMLGEQTTPGNVRETISGKQMKCLIDLQIMSLGPKFISVAWEYALRSRIEKESSFNAFLMNSTEAADPLSTSSRGDCSVEFDLIVIAESISDDHFAMYWICGTQPGEVWYYDPMMKALPNLEKLNKSITFCKERYKRLATEEVFTLKIAKNRYAIHALVIV